MDKEILVIWIVSFLGAISLVMTFCVFKRKNQGFGARNQRVVGIILIATFASLLGALSPQMTTAAMGILGAIAGYLFGKSDSGDDNSG